MLFFLKKTKILTKPTTINDVLRGTSGQRQARANSGHELLLIFFVFLKKQSKFNRIFVIFLFFLAKFSGRFWLLLIEFGGFVHLIFLRRPKHSQDLVDMKCVFGNAKSAVHCEFTEFWVELCLGNACFTSTKPMLYFQTTLGNYCPGVC